MVTARPEADAETPPDAAPQELGGDDGEGAGEVTRVRARPQELYSVEIWRGGVRQTVVPVGKQNITIGRGSKTVEVDLPIKSDPEVSRVHATLEVDNTGKYWLTSKGRNPTLVEGRELPRDEAVEVRPDEKIEICSFTLRIQPR
jgi:pSer/pThr/pTyr-binding forkhead associated (FHA) protein